MTKTGSPALEPELLHRFKNLLGISLGFCDLALADLDANDPRRTDLVEVQKAIREALALLPALIRQS